MAYQLGITVDTLKVLLYRDGDLDTSLTRVDADGVTGIAWGDVDVRLVFPEDGDTREAREAGAWHATVVGAVATWQVDKALTNLRPNRALVELWVDDQCWAAGKVSKKGLRGVTA